jgi:hypothetical protein
MCDEMRTEMIQGKKGQLTTAALGAITTVVRLAETTEVIAVGLIAAADPSVRMAVGVLCAVVMLVAPAQAWSATSSEVLAPVAAVTVSTGAPPMREHLVAGRSASGDLYRTLLHFDLGGVAAEAVESATLVLTEHECLEGDVSAYRVTSEWTGSVSWGAQPDVDLGRPIAGVRTGSCLGPALTFDLTEEVGAWLAGFVPDFGVEIRAREDGETVRAFDATDLGTPPYLVLAYAQDSPPPPDPVPASAGGDVYPAAASAQLSDAATTTGGSDRFRVGRTGVGERTRVLLDFDLPPVDVDQLWNATLVLRERGCGSSNAAITAYRVGEPWSADAVGWTGQPTLASAVGTIPGGGCDAWQTLDVTEAVRRWSTGAWGSFGIALVGDETRPGTERLLAGSGESDGPYLVVNGLPLFAGPGAPPPPPQPAAAAPPVLVRGVVVEAGGTPIAGASLDVFPFGEPTAGQVTRLGHTVTDAQGAFALRVPLTAPGIADAARRNGGWADFELLVSAGARSYPRVFSRRLGQDVWLVDEEDRSANDEPLRIQLDSTSAIAAGGPGVRTFKAPVATPSSGCPGYQVTLLGTEVQPTKVGQMHIYNDSYMSFAYGERAHSSIDVLVSRNGGPFTFYGLVNRGSGESSSVGTSRDFRGQNASFGKWFRTNFEYRKIRTRFDCQDTHWVEDAISAKRWIGGFDLIGDLTHLNGRCGNNFRRFKQGYGKGWVAHEGRKLRKYGYAAAVFGVGVGAQSYGERWIKWKYNFGTKYDKHWLCGDTDYPIRARTVYAGL